MRRHNIWRLNYQRNRYCRRLSQGQLNERIRDVFFNLLRLTPRGQIGLLEMDAAGSRWLELWTHVLEEMDLRNGPSVASIAPDVLFPGLVPDFVGVLAQRAASALARVDSPGVLIRFGKPKVMRDLFDRGSIRIHPASYYRKPDNVGAVRDDELALECSLLLNRDQIVEVVSNPQDVPAEPHDLRIDVRYESKTDYWVYCLTAVVEPRLFVDFNAEACVVIKDRMRFCNTLRAAFQQHTENISVREGDVVYVDPLLPQSATVDVPMSKHFRYSYQHEYRLVWEPITPRKDLGYIELEAGSLRSYADLIVL